MSLKKRILVMGPISDFGGREVMTNLLAHSLKGRYEIRVVSTIAMSKHSVALEGISSSWDTVNYDLYRRYSLLKFSAWLTKSIYSRKEQVYDFVNNKISKIYFDFEQHYYNSIFRYIDQSNCVIYSGEIDGKWFKEIIDICNQLKKPLVLRITGEIKKIPVFLKSDYQGLHVLAHSLSNATKINSLNYKVWHIDQTTVLEEELIKLPIDENRELTYGFLGRFSPEKGILELIETFAKSGKKLLIAGNGPLLKNVKSSCAVNPNIIYKGQLLPQEVADFYSNLDVFIISSFEEGGPIVGIEAMASGRLIISTKVGAMEERLHKTGNSFWFNINDKKSLNSAIDNLESLSTLERTRIRMEVRKRYLDCNSLQNTKKKYLGIFNEILVK